MNSASLPTSGDATLKDAAPAEGLPLDPALAAAQPGAALPQAFLQFMQMDAAAPAEPLPEPAAAEAQEEGAETGPEAAGQPLLAAMNMPLMPSMMATPATLPAAVRLAAGMQETQERAAAAVPAAARDGAVQLPLAAAIAATAGAPAPAVLQAAEGTHGARTGAPAHSAQTTAAPQQAAVSAPAASGDGAGADGQATSGNGSGAGNGANFGIAAPSAPNAAPRDGGTLTLSGPPTAWRQSLQEALGDRLSLQLGKNAEQAVIRLEPPMLGRVEISIRHAAGSLEVNITATHSEVLRQLNTVSENLRSDLAQRQYSDVSVNVSQATPRAQAGAQAGAFGADAQGRGRQQGQDQDERAPGAALAEANQSTGAFSLNGRA